ncbi:MAG TPA: LytTR family DNA-binding domain-containing protein [Rubricoccaceae bacterium]|nr:LytTR family DNA-binding domain-containing protein [Rubricoccaceae bacterium]
MRAVLVDDERLARAELRRLLREHPEVEVVAEAADAEAAREALEAHHPDLVFLDVQMPGESGFELLASLEAAPAVIFTTAHDAYALRAFEVNALDYLLKPIEPRRLAAALERVRAAPPGGRGVLTEADRVFVKDGERYWFVRLGDVRLFESEGNYTRLYFGHERPLVARSLSVLEARLDPAVFFRASRRHLLNLRWVRGLRPWGAGGLLVQIEGGPEVQMSRRQARLFRERRGL